MRRSVTVLLVLLAACGGPSREREAAERQLASSTWGLRRLAGINVPGREQETATLQFGADHRLHGTNRCNDVSSGEAVMSLLGVEVSLELIKPSYRWWSDAEGATGSFSPGTLIHTRVGCLPREDNAIADRFWQAMGHARRWSVLHDRMRVVFDDGASALLVRLSRHSATESRASDVTRHEPAQVRLVGGSH